ncbi:MAG: DNA-protecting protein DprA [Candidatus Nealsonbacteria bacterium]|nr:DNA-protecting protein DprA [Candidatus Nealsonbacteria bacterium]
MHEGFKKGGSEKCLGIYFGKKVIALMACQVTLQDKKYPKLLKEIGKSAPKQLYYKGVFDESIFENCLAVVGSRRMTTYGRQVVERLVGEAAAAGITIVSGFMYGVDAAAHKTSLRVGGKTIAVMPCGIDLIHPEYQQDLYAEILENKGLVISEYEGEMQPVTWTYPQRNRIVAGLSKATLVVEAGDKSGSLITARLAQKFKRKLFVVPGPITSENSKGIMQLIKEGATPVSSANEVISEYPLRKQNFGKSSPPSPASRDPRPNPDFQNSFSTLEDKILQQLQREPGEIDLLARVFCLPVSKLSMTLSIMELRGIIKQEGNKYYVN